jgi:hypothetical protein
MAICSDLNYIEFGNAGPARLWDGDVALVMQRKQSRLNVKLQMLI